MTQLGTRWRLLSQLCPLRCHLSLSSGCSGWTRRAVGLPCLPDSPVNHTRRRCPPRSTYPDPGGLPPSLVGEGWHGDPPFRPVLYTANIPPLSLLARSLGSSVALVEDSSTRGQNILENHFASSLLASYLLVVRASLFSVEEQPPAHSLVFGWDSCSSSLPRQLLRGQAPLGAPFGGLERSLPLLQRTSRNRPPGGCSATMCDSTRSMQILQGWAAPRR